MPIVINSLIDKHAPLTQITKRKVKTKSKPWLATGILTSIKNKNKIYNKLCRAKDQTRKDHLYHQFKKYRNFFSNLTKQSKENYYKQYFKENKDNLIKIWKEVKEVILTKKINKAQSDYLTKDNRLIYAHKEVADEFSNFFGTIAENIDKKTPRSKKNFSDYSFLLNPVTEKEIANIISTFSTRKAIG